MAWDGRATRPRGQVMRDNTRTKERFELALDARQVAVIAIGSLVIVAGAFVLGVTAGRHGLVAPAPAVIAAPKDPLARLDDPLPVREEPPPELKAHQALTDGRAIEQSLPVAPAKPALALAPPPAATAASMAPGPAAAEPPPVNAEVSWTKAAPAGAKPAAPAPATAR